MNIKSGWWYRYCLINIFFVLCMSHRLYIISCKYRHQNIFFSNYTKTMYAKHFLLYHLSKLFSVIHFFIHWGTGLFLHVIFFTGYFGGNCKQVNVLKCYIMDTCFTWILCNIIDVKHHQYGNKIHLFLYLWLVFEENV